jgi:hypothetical protein
MSSWLGQRNVTFTLAFGIEKGRSIV